MTYFCRSLVWSYEYLRGLVSVELPLTPQHDKNGRFRGLDESAFTGAKVGGNCPYVSDLQQNQNGWCVASTKVVLLTSGAPRLLHEAVELISSRWDRPPTGVQLTESLRNQGCTQRWERRQEHFYLFIIYVFYSRDLCSAHQLLNSHRCLVLLPGGRLLKKKKKRERLQLLLLPTLIRPLKLNHVIKQWARTPTSATYKRHSIQRLNWDLWGGKSTGFKCLFF